jgi:hypothetical protein
MIAAHDSEIADPEPLPCKVENFPSRDDIRPGLLPSGGFENHGSERIELFDREARLFDQLAQKPDP